MPYLTYKGPFYERRSPDPTIPAFIRGQSREVSQDWLDAHRRKISDAVFLIEGDEGVHFDEGNDGIPDMSWTKVKIVEWLEDNSDGVGGGYKTKSKLLEMVDAVLNPPAPVVEEPTPTEVEVEEVVEEVVEEQTQEE